MNGITSRCISFAQGDIDCLKRVNYKFGLVLGEAEFINEQCYFLEKEYMHNRALHGYGTVSGLLVGKEDKDPDLEIQVDPGIGIDQYGRLFVIRDKQCANLTKWLEEQGDVGDQTIYVIARYDDCPTDLVPIAGQPCSTSDQQTAASRILDSFHIELTLKKPLHPARDAVVNLAEFLSRFRVDLAAPDRSDLGDPTRLAPVIGPEVITADPSTFINDIDDFVESETGVAGATILTIQPNIVESLLNDIFVYWITEVRPTLNPDLIDPGKPLQPDGNPFPPDVLLAELTLTLADDGTLTLDGIAIDNTTRPYLLHTQLIQELFDIPELAGEDGEVEPQKDVSEFVTIKDVPGRIRTMSLWIHIDQNLNLTEDNTSLMRVESNGAIKEVEINTLTEDVRRRNEVGRYYTLTTFSDLDDGDFLFLRFDTDRIQVSSRPPQTLSRYIAASDFTYENYNVRQARIYKFHIVDRPNVTIDEEVIRQLIIRLMPPQEPVIPFVTATPITARANLLVGYELWFHFDGNTEQNDGGIETLDKANFAMYVEDAFGSVNEVNIEEYRRIRPNLWLIIPSPDNQAVFPLVRFAFSLQKAMGIKAYNPNTGALDGFDSLEQYIDGTNQRLEGHIMSTKRFEEGDALVVYAREQSAAGEIVE